jgi:tRNA (guanine-N7-)-methyltransferase
MIQPEPRVSEPPSRPVRRIQSFVRREGRLTRAQSRALETLWPRYGIEPRGMLAMESVFGRRAPCTLEIGFGNGETLARLARTNPAQNYLGIEVHSPGIGHLLLAIANHGIANVRIVRADAVTVLGQHIPDASLDRILVFFPDPWPKKRHHKRRLIQPPFIDLVRRRLRPRGVLHLATDCEDYAASMLGVLESASGLRNLAGAGRYALRPRYRPLTRFELRGLRLGHAVRDLLFERTG